jgi:mevalonate kinase
MLLATTQVWLGTPPCASRNSDVYMGVTASAPAKVILFGEHFVVYGEPAIVLAIDKRAYAKVELRQDKRLYLRSANLNLAGYFENGYFKVEQGDAKEAKLRFKPLKLTVEKVLEIYGDNVGLDVEVNSTVPVAASLGSSAAVAAAVTAAVSALLEVTMSKESVFRISYEAEKIVHGKPSEVDPAVSTFGGTLLFQMDTGFRPLDVKGDVPLVIGYTGVKRSTRVQVAKVRDVRNKYSRVIDHIMMAAREIVLSAINALKDGNLETLGDLMNIDHALLCGLGTSDESLEWLVNAARKAGALGAKLTGAGGGGCMIALAENETLKQVLEAIQRAGGSPFVARKTDEGVRVEGI